MEEAITAQEEQIYVGIVKDSLVCAITVHVS
jgi:hypothetical protein